MTNLTSDEKKALIRMALEAREQAYAPYSDFMVGKGLSPTECVSGTKERTLATGG